MLVDHDYAGEIPETGAEMRRALRDVIERALSLLDALDADPDLEEGGDAEMSLGWEHGRPSTYCIDLFEDAEATVLETHGKGFLPSGGDDTEDNDPGGGDILDELHDGDEEDTGIADVGGYMEQAGGFLWNADEPYRTARRQAVDRELERLGFRKRKAPRFVANGNQWGRMQ